MQLKIAHKIYATDSFVSNFDDSVTKECKTCNVKNNIIHLFLKVDKREIFFSWFFIFLSCFIYIPFVLQNTIICKNHFVT